MLPFVLLATRPEDEVADAEYEQFLAASGLDESGLRRYRLDRGPLPELDLERLSGVVIGGSPLNASDEQASKSAVQRRIEGELNGLLTRIGDEDFPFMGACYGVGTLGLHQGAIVDHTYGEKAGAVEVSLTEDGRADPLCADLPDRFDAFVGHKEAVRVLPPHATLLATGVQCPVQMFRVGRNQYATQFHPELDVEGFVDRIRAYPDGGYYEPGQVGAVESAVRGLVVTAPMKLMRAFVVRYAR